MVRKILLLIIFFAFILRIYALNFGFPFLQSRPDETIAMYMALGYGTGDFNPHNFHWPSLFSYIIFILYGIYILLGFLINHFYTWEDVLKEIAVNPVNYLLISRLVSAMCGTLTVYFIYKVGKLFYNKAVGIISSVFLAFTYLHVRDSHFGTPDILMVFLIVVTFYFIGRIFETHSLHNYIYTGIFFGLATSAKYSAFILIVTILIAHFFVVKENSANYFNKKIVLLFLFALVSFTITTPFWIFDFSTFLSDFSFELRHLIEGHEGIILGRGWWYHINFSLWYGLGGPLLVLSLCGVVYNFLFDMRKSLLIFSFPITYYVIIGSGYTVFVRYILPVVPFAVISTAVVYVSSLNYLMREKIVDYKYYLANSVAIILIVIPSISNVVQFDYIFSKKDNRVVVAEWIEKNFNPGVSIGFIGSKYARIPLSKKFKLNYRYNNVKISKNINNNELPLYLIVEYSPLYFYSQVPDEIKKIIWKKYEIYKSFKASCGNKDKGQYDQQDAFYLPYFGFSGIIRPGPNFLIYKRK